MDNERIDLLESKSVGSSVLRLAIPTMLAMAVQLVYNMTDTYFIGLTGDHLLVAAISLAMPVFLFVQAIGNVFAIGTSSYVSRKLGEKELVRLDRVSKIDLGFPHEFLASPVIQDIVYGGTFDEIDNQACACFVGLKLGRGRVSPSIALRRAATIFQERLGRG